jgi:hypothetical protein
MAPVAMLCSVATADATGMRAAPPQATAQRCRALRAVEDPRDGATDARAAVAANAMDLKHSGR